MAPAPVPGNRRGHHLFLDSGVRQRGPVRGLASALGQAQAVRAVSEHVHSAGNMAGRERRGETVGVFGRDVGVLCGVPDEERRRLGRDQRIQGCRPAQLRTGVLAEKETKKPAEPGMSERGIT